MITEQMYKDIKTICLDYSRPIGHNLIFICKINKNRITNNDPAFILKLEISSGELYCKSDGYFYNLQYKTPDVIRILDTPETILLTLMELQNG